MLLKGVEQGNGLEAVRQLFQNLSAFFTEQIPGFASFDHAVAQFRYACSTFTSNFEAGRFFS